MSKAKLLEVLKSYLRAAVAAVLAAITLGKTDPKDLAIAAGVAVAGPALKALDKSAKQFGIGS
jgi:hypothetical protein